MTYENVSKMSHGIACWVFCTHYCIPEEETGPYTRDDGCNIQDLACVVHSFLLIAYKRTKWSELLELR